MTTFHVNISVNITDLINIREHGDQMYNKAEKEREKGFCTRDKMWSTKGPPFLA